MSLSTQIINKCLIFINIKFKYYVKNWFNRGRCKNITI